MEDITAYVIQANTGHRTVCRFGNDIWVGDEVIAWRIEIYRIGKFSEFHTQTFCSPIIAMGDPGDDCIGTQDKDGRVAAYGSVYGSIENLKAELGIKDEND